MHSPSGESEAEAAIGVDPASPHDPPPTTHSQRSTHTGFVHSIPGHAIHTYRWSETSDAPATELMAFAQLAPDNARSSSSEPAWDGTSHETARSSSSEPAWDGAAGSASRKIANPAWDVTSDSARIRTSEPAWDGESEHYRIETSEPGWPADGTTSRKPAQTPLSLAAAFGAIHQPDTTRIHVLTDRNAMDGDAAGASQRERSTILQPASAVEAGADTLFGSGLANVWHMPLLVRDEPNSPQRSSRRLV